MKQPGASPDEQAQPGPGQPPASVTAPGEGPAAPPSSRGVAEPTASAGMRRESATGSVQTGDFEQRWHQIQAGFVDEPRQAIERADAFFEELLERFQRERQELRQLWERGENVSTEDLR